ncbi:MAG: hypothetical protein ACK5NF_04285 [Bacilli bacterium]
MTYQNDLRLSNLSEYTIAVKSDYYENDKATTHSDDELKEIEQLIKAYISSFFY